MVVHEEKVLLSADRLGRVAIVRRQDGLFCLYSHWRWTMDVQRAFRVEPVQDLWWTADYDPALYFDAEHQIETQPLSGIYGTIEDAENEARRILKLDEVTED